MKKTILMMTGVTVLSTGLYAGIALGREDAPADKVMPPVNSIWLDTNGCTPQLTKDLEKIKYALTSSRDTADAVLKVDVHQLDAHTGASARYTANLLDQKGKTLFTTSGREDSISQEELCEDISEGIRDRLKDRTAAVR